MAIRWNSRPVAHLTICSCGRAPLRALAGATARSELRRERRSIAPTIPLIISPTAECVGIGDRCGWPFTDHDARADQWQRRLGKGLVQSVSSLGRYALKMTTAKWYTRTAVIQQRSVSVFRLRVSRGIPGFTEKTRQRSRPRSRSDAGRTFTVAAAITRDIHVLPTPTNAERSCSTLRSKDGMSS